ncbi:thioredoxin family protein [Hyunsoonleella sp. 2307UL5-6]|uniref:thioredoxin family protein n=1 Tax=Hyunsoonleella sp. 2307UL5-6 TaxID=3384768 RepID=UPI0039BC7BBD
MKNFIQILVFTLVVCFSSANAQEINWVSLEEAIKLQKKTPKKIMMDVYTVWCGPCKMLDKNTFRNPDVAEYVNENYYAVKFNGEGNDVVDYKDKSYSNPSYNASKANKRNSPHQLARYLQIKAYPTIVFFDENADVIAPIAGYLIPTKLELYLKMFKNNKHKDIKTQEDFNAYYKTFKAEFKD